MNYVKSEKKCVLRGTGCLGAGHCNYYKERRPEDAVKQTAASVFNQAKVRVFPRGAYVIHKHFGKGVIISSNANRTSVLFEAAGKKTFLTASLSDKNLFLPV